MFCRIGDAKLGIMIELAIAYPMNLRKPCYDKPTFQLHLKSVDVNIGPSNSMARFGDLFELFHRKNSSIPIPLPSNWSDAKECLIPFYMEDLGLPFDKVFSAEIQIKSHDLKFEIVTSCTAVLKKGPIGLVGNKKEDELWVHLTDCKELNEQVILNSNATIRLTGYFDGESILSYFQVLG